MKYDVTLFPEVSVKVTGVEACSPAEAIAAAYDLVDWRSLFSQTPLPPGVAYVEFQDEIACALVDVAGDTEYTHSRWYGPDGETSLPPASLLDLARLLQDWLDRRHRSYQQWDEFEGKVRAVLGQEGGAQ